MPQFVITRDSKLYKEWVFPHADIMMIGGAPTNTLVLPDRSQKVSQYHAAIVRAPGPGDASKRPLTQANLRCKGSSALNRGHEHHHAIKRCSACERRPRRAGGVQRGSGT